VTGFASLNTTGTGLLEISVRTRISIVCVALPSVFTQSQSGCADVVSPGFSMHTQDNQQLLNISGFGALQYAAKLSVLVRVCSGWLVSLRGGPCTLQTACVLL
jgi:hypothetical protein